MKPNRLAELARLAMQRERDNRDRPRRLGLVAGKAVYRPACIAKISARLGSTSTSASAVSVSPPSSTVTPSGFATTLLNQAGLVSAPAADAKT
jgi:hypothetical protein